MLLEAIPFDPRKAGWSLCLVVTVSIPCSENKDLASLGYTQGQKTRLAKNHRPRTHSPPPMLSAHPTLSK